MLAGRGGCVGRFDACESGMVLVIVLWIMALLAVMAGSFAYSMRIETRLATDTVERAQARALAEAGVAYALAWQLDPEAQKQWPPNGDLREWSFGGGRLRIQVVDAGGLVNLNTANTELLKALLASAGVDAQDQDRLADAIQDWRDPDDQSLPHGAEGGDYRSAGRPGPKNAPFESIEELGEVLGVTQAIYERIADVETVFSYHSGVNPELAPARLLQALGLDERTVADYLRTRTSAAVDGLPAPPLQFGDDQSFFSPSRASVYHIAVTAETQTGTPVIIKAVIDGREVATGQNPRVLAWRVGR
ncbi:MAG: type II secretion system protein GspK [Candidatus Competibacter sp.]|nr:type II secretion system protein GspK [Candidatus Competibacter sp.]MDG4584075.1 type II secretion system protein GspK [Candidatus Competibacter sp.]